MFIIGSELFFLKLSLNDIPYQCHEMFPSWQNLETIKTRRTLSVTPETDLQQL